MIGSHLPLTATMEATGEVVAIDLTTDALAAYAEAVHHLALLEATRQRRIDALVANDGILTALADEIAELHATVHATDLALTTLWPDDLRQQAGTIRVQAPGVAIVWPKPARVTVQDLSPADVARQYPEFADKIGVHEVTRKAPPPRITLVNGYRGVA